MAIITYTAAETAIIQKLGEESRQAYKEEYGYHPERDHVGILTGDWDSTAMGVDQPVFERA